MTNIKNIFSSACFNILKELLVVQKQTKYQQKAHDLSYLELEGQGRGFIRRVPRPLAVRAYFVEFYGRVFGFWLFAFYDISRTPLLSYSHFQGVKLKLRLRAFFWCIVCFSTSTGSFQILNSKIFRIWLLHPVGQSYFEDFTLWILINGIW